MNILTLRFYHDTFHSLIHVFDLYNLNMYYMHHSSNCISIEHWPVKLFIVLLASFAVYRKKVEDFQHKIIFFLKFQPWVYS